MRSPAIACLLFISVAGSAGCIRGLVSFDPWQEPNSYMPMAVGNRWVYIDSTGTASMEEISRREGEYFYREGIRIGHALRPDGLVQVTFTNGIPSQPTYLIRTPVRKGNSWTHGDLVYEITDTSKSIDVRAGHFDNCLELRVKKKSVFFLFRKEGIVATEILLTFAPGVGLAETVVQQGPRVIYRRELVRYFVYPQTS